MHVGLMYYLIYYLFTICVNLLKVSIVMVMIYFRNFTNYFRRFGSHFESVLFMILGKLSTLNDNAIRLIK